MVSIAAFQAVDPGSIPGRRIYFTTPLKQGLVCRMGDRKLKTPQNAQACRDQDSNLGYCGHNAGS